MNQDNGAGSGPFVYAQDQALSGGFRHRSAMSRTFSMKCGPVLGSGPGLALTSGLADDFMSEEPLSARAALALFEQLGRGSRRW
jgi:hypothetical protein